MGFLSKIIPSESLMEWREPNAYSKRDLFEHGRWIGFLIFLMIPSIVLVTSPNLGKAGTILALFFMITGALAFLRVWLGPGNAVCLKEDCITKATSRPPRRTPYQYIKICKIRHDNYKNDRFCIMEFSFEKNLPAGQVNKIVLPSNVDLDRVVQILRSKGVTVIGT